MKNALPSRLPAFAGAAADRLVRFLTGLLAALLILYSGYVLWDTFYLERTAFVSEDLLQYKPQPDAPEDPGFEELRAINPDLRAWLTLEDTHIDYPVVQGIDDMYYVNRDVYGKSSLSGSIYLSSANAPDFSDPYNLIYGHHMANGAMFGDIDRFAEPAFLAGHRSGLLILPERVYDLHLFACVETDAYEWLIYNASNRSAEDFPQLLDYMREHALSFEEPEEGFEKLLALSTCSDATTNGRLVLFAFMIERTEPLPESPAEKKAAPPAVKGHGVGEYWALLNLFCVIYCFWVLMPVRLRSVRLPYLRLVGRRGKSRGLSPRAWLGLIAEALIALGALVLFLLTEDPSARLTVIDEFTPWMLLLCAAALTVELTVLRPDEKRRELR